MISWYVGTEKGFNFSLGKNYKFLDKHISKELWDNLLNTYSMSSYEEMWKSFDLCLCLFKKYLKKWQIHLVIIILIMMKTLQNIWKHKREFQINIFMVIGIDKYQFIVQLIFRRGVLEWMKIKRLRWKP